MPTKKNRTGDGSDGSSMYKHKQKLPRSERVVL